MSQFSFPILENDELLPCLEEMEVPLTAAQMGKPTYEIVRPLFENMLINLTGITREELNQPVFAAIDAFEYPELHDESIATRNFLRHLGKLMANTGVKDFTMKDIYKPEPLRLRRHLSAIINFAKFREEKLVMYTEVQARIDALVEAKGQLAAEGSQQAAELRQLQEARASEEEAASRVEAEVAELTATNQALNKQHNALAAEVKSLKTQLNGLAEAAQAEKLELLNARQEAERLSGQIVQSPEKFQKSLADLQAAVEEERHLVAESERHCRELQVRADGVAKVDKEVQRCVELMGEIEADVARKKTASRRVKGLREAIAAAQMEAADLEARQQHLKRQAANLKDRLRKLDSQAALKREAAESALEEQQRERELVEAENAMQAARMRENEAAIRATTERLRELQDAHGRRLGAMLDRYGALRKEVTAYNGRLAAAMAEGAPLCAEAADDGGAAVVALSTGVAGLAVHAGGDRRHFRDQRQ